MSKFYNNLLFILLPILVFSGCYTVVKNDREAEIEYIQDYLTATTWRIIKNNALGDTTLIFQRTGHYIKRNCDDCPTEKGIWKLKDNRLIMEKYYDLSINLSSPGNYVCSYRYDISEVTNDSLVLKGVLQEVPPLPRVFCCTGGCIEEKPESIPVYTYVSAKHL